MGPSPHQDDGNADASLARISVEPPFRGGPLTPLPSARKFGGQARPLHFTRPFALYKITALKQKGPAPPRGTGPTNYQAIFAQDFFFFAFTLMSMPGAICCNWASPSLAC